MRFLSCWILPIVLWTYGLPTSVDTNGPDAVKVATGFVRALETGAYDHAWTRLSPDMRKALSVDALTETWESLPTQLGRYRASGSSTSTMIGALATVNVPLTYEHGQLDAEIAVDTSGQIVGLHFQIPSAFLGKSQDVLHDQQSIVAHEVVIGGENGVSGTLLMPRMAQSEPVPALLLVPGSGPQDRDGTVGANRPYADIARGLGALGIATLRFDKRTLVRPEEFEGPGISLEQEVGSDVTAALALLGNTRGVDPKRIFVFGHSLGGIAAVYATQEPSVAGLVLFAAPSRPILDLLVDQVRYIGSLDGSLDANESEGIRQLKEQVARVRSGDLEGSLLGAPAPYWADLEGRNVVTVALGLHKPVLLLQGGRDYQVTAADWKIWQERAAGHPEITLREYPSLNHLGISGTARSAPDDYLIPGQVDQGMIQDIADWLLHGALPD